MSMIARQRKATVGAKSSAGTSTSAIPAQPRVSICVLPFSNMSGDLEQEYFSDGISEDIITDLSKVSALAVVSRNTAFTFKGKHVDLPQVARQLKVNYVLEGSVRRAGGRVRITAQLIEASSDNHLWAERYDRDLNDIFALQDEISEAIVTALKLKLLPEEKKAIEQRGTTNLRRVQPLPDGAASLRQRQLSDVAQERHGHPPVPGRDRARRRITLTRGHCWPATQRYRLSEPAKATMGCRGHARH